MAQEAQAARGACASARAARARHGAVCGRSNDLGQSCGWLPAYRSLVASRCVREMLGVTTGHGDSPTLQEASTAGKRPKDDCLRPSRIFVKPVPVESKILLTRPKPTFKHHFKQQDIHSLCKLQREPCSTGCTTLIAALTFGLHCSNSCSVRRPCCIRAPQLLKASNRWRAARCSPHASPKR